MLNKADNDGIEGDLKLGTKAKPMHKLSTKSKVFVPLSQKPKSGGDKMIDNEIGGVINMSHHIKQNLRNAINEENKKGKQKKSWSGKYFKYSNSIRSTCEYSSYKISLSNPSDPRTTVMIKNIPNKYTQSLLIEELDINFSNKYDFLYLPIDFENKCNVGYAFVNFIYTESVFEIYSQWNSKTWPRFNSQKVCEISYARVQGLKQLKKHFKTSSVMSNEKQEYKPVFG